MEAWKVWSASSQPLKQLIHLASSTTRRTSSRFIVSCCSPSTTTATTAGGGSRIAGRNRRSASSSSSSTSDRDAIRAIRLKKVEELRNKGLEPYAYKWDRTHTANQLQDIYRHLGNGEELNSESDYVSIAGRIVARRAFGKLAFFTLRDDSGTIQLYCEKERLLNEQFEQLKTLVDIGDILGVSGSIKRTEKGELSVYVNSFAILTKSLLPLPDKYHGLTDVDKRYRQRYVDMIANPEVADIFRKRAKIVSAIRRTVESSGFVEVETPVLQGAAGGAEARPFVTYHNSLGRDLYLRIATELHLKRMLVGGSLLTNPVVSNGSPMDKSSVFAGSWLALGLVLAWALVAPQAEARAFFVFGDSLVDSGNNDYLFTTARADSPPYGIDYPTGRPTGRFSNGLNIPDILSEQIGSEPTLPYLSPELTGERLLVGANFASAGIGILNDTGIQFLNIIRIWKQLEYFRQYQQRVSGLIGVEQTQRLVNQALVLITLGGNDFVNNYYLVPYSARSRQFSLPDYVRYLISEYRKVLIRLFELGARRVLVTATGPLGCVPAELALRSRTGECAIELQRAAGLFNPQLFQMLDGLNNEIGSQVFIAANAFGMHMDFISNPQAYGFVTSKVACCGQGPYNGLGLCTVASSLCPNRNLYAFWDAFHPSERANRIIVQRILTGSTEYMYPMNLSTIMDLDSRI